MNKYKLIALDMDGTLTNDDKIITPKTKQALLEVQKLGAKVVLASGRPTTGLYQEAEELRLGEFGGKLLSYNGARVSEAVNRKIIFERRLPDIMTRQLLRHLRQFPVTIMFDDGKNLFTTDRGGYSVAVEARITHLNLVEIKAPEEHMVHTPIKLLLSAEPELMRQIEFDIVRPFPELDFVRSTPFYLEALNKGISKGDSLKTLAETMGIRQEEVMAFGDEHNDLTMLDYAGLGVGMENSCQAVLDMCDEITLSNNRDGVAHTLKKYFLI